MLHKAVPLEALCGALRDVEGTLIGLQRNPESGELERVTLLTGRPLHDLTALNEDLEGMLALQALLEDTSGSATPTCTCAPEWAGPRGCWFKVLRNGAGWPQVTNHPGSRVFASTVRGRMAIGAARLHD